MSLRAWMALAVTVLASPSCSKSPGARQAPSELHAGGVAWRVESGSWRVEGDALVGSGGHLRSAEELTNGTFELDVEQASPPSGTVGLGFRYELVQDNLARSSGYSLRLAGPAFNVLRGANDYWLPVSSEVRGMSTSSILDAKKNHFVLVMEGSSFRIDANGASLFDFVDASHPRGHIDLWVESPREVRFSNVHVAARKAD